MLDMKRIRENPDEIRAALKARRSDIDLAPFFELDQKRRSMIGEVEALRAKSNADSKQIPIKKKNGEDVTAILAEMKELSKNAMALLLSINSYSLFQIAWSCYTSL